MAIKTLAEIQKEISTNKSHQAYMLESRREENKNNKAKSWVIAIVCAMLVLLTQNVAGNGYFVLFMAIIVGFVAYKLTLEKSAFIWHNEFYGNELTLLFANHFPFLEHLKDYGKKSEIVLNNRFLLQYNNFIASSKFVYTGNINNQKMELIEFDKNTLLISILENNNWITNDLHIAKRTNLKLVENLKLATKQKFDYFPELMQHFDVYTEQKAKAAQFLQANEDIFLQITQFEKYNLVISFINNQVHCLLRGIDMDLLADVAYEVNLTKEEVSDYFQQLEELSNFINLLQQIR